MALTSQPLPNRPLSFETQHGSVAGKLRRRDQDFIPEPHFLGAISLERKRAERSGKPVVLMLLDVQPIIYNGNGNNVRRRAVSAVCTTTRETDIAGWYKEPSVLGVIFTELGEAGPKAISESIRARVFAGLLAHLDAEQVSRLPITLHFFPEDPQTPGTRADLKFYPDSVSAGGATGTGSVVKRSMDIVGSLIALILLLPVFAVIAALIKLTSPGPVLFRQSRVGKYGAPFTFMKFRSMYANNDPSTHKEFVTRLIAGAIPGDGSANQKPVFKLTNDPRVTKIGRFLRKTSLDELPQFINVLKGEMSLIGPRPPLPYEFEKYDIWHRRRVMEIKPGITGLWQVNGRSRTSFDEMVRLDLKYMRAWSIWLDLKILLQTPAAVLMGDGAY